MTSNFIENLKQRFGRFLPSSPNAKPRGQDAGDRSGTLPREDSELLLREYQLYLWGSALGPWY